MGERPELKIGLKGETFRNFYYLKEELVDFCRKNNLPTSGGKLELTDRIATFLDTGNVMISRKVSKKSTLDIVELTEQTIIENNFVCSERHRAFFKEKIGKSFSFNVQFQKWLKSNSGKTYKDAIEANKGMSLDDAITCWKYKKSLQGHNRYEKSDLIALKQIPILR